MEDSGSHGVRAGRFQGAGEFEGAEEWGFCGGHGLNAAQPEAVWAVLHPRNRAIGERDHLPFFAFDEGHVADRAFFGPVRKYARIHGAKELGV